PAVRPAVRDHPRGLGQKTTNTPDGSGVFIEKLRRRPTLPGGLPPSTIGAGGLNCRVRDGNGGDTAAMATGNPLSSGLPHENSRASTSLYFQALGRLVPVG